MIKWPDHDAGVQTLPKTFKQYSPRLTGIIDCTEIFIDRLKKLRGDFLQNHALFAQNQSDHTD